jgi:hypothetical protein
MLSSERLGSQNNNFAAVASAFPVNVATASGFQFFNNDDGSETLPY